MNRTQPALGVAFCSFSVALVALGCAAGDSAEVPASSEAVASDEAASTVVRGSINVPSRPATPRRCPGRPPAVAEKATYCPVGGFDRAMVAAGCRRPAKFAYHPVLGERYVALCPNTDAVRAAADAGPVINAVVDATFCSDLFPTAPPGFVYVTFYSRCFNPLCSNNCIDQGSLGETLPE